MTFTSSGVYFLTIISFVLPKDTRTFRFVSLTPSGNSNGSKKTLTAVGLVRSGAGSASDANSTFTSSGSIISVSYTHLTLPTICSV